MHEVMQKQPWAVAVLGLVLVIVGTVVADSKSLSGNPLQLVFDLAAITGWILLVWGVIILIKHSRSKKAK